MMKVVKNPDQEVKVQIEKKVQNLDEVQVNLSLHHQIES